MINTCQLGAVGCRVALLSQTEAVGKPENTGGSLEEKVAITWPCRYSPAAPVGEKTTALIRASSKANIPDKDAETMRYLDGLTVVLVHSGRLAQVAPVQWNNADMV